MIKTNSIPLIARISTPMKDSGEWQVTMFPSHAQASSSASIGTMSQRPKFHRHLVNSLLRALCEEQTKRFLGFPVIMLWSSGALKKERTRYMPTIDKIRCCLIGYRLTQNFNWPYHCGAL